MRKPFISKLLMIWTVALAVESIGIYTHYTTETITTPYISSDFNVRAIEPEIVEVKSEKQEVIEYIVEVFGEESPEMLAIIRLCENSKFDQEAQNTNSNGTKDKGVAQINSVHISGVEFESCKGAYDNWRSNINCAKDIKDKYGFSAWSCSSVIGVTPFYLN